MNKCMYCGKEVELDELHFVCPVCKNGMCDDCYHANTEHDMQVSDLDDIDDGNKFDSLIESMGGNTTYYCFKCLGEYRNEK